MTMSLFSFAAWDASQITATRARSGTNAGAGAGGGAGWLRRWRQGGVGTTWRYTDGVGHAAGLEGANHAGRAAKYVVSNK